jgi:hypothetical protein
LATVEWEFAVADRIEQEIEEILAKFDKMPGDEGGGHSPIPIGTKRKRRASASAGVRKSAGGVGNRLTPTALLFAGAGTMVAGLLLANFWSPLIWASFAGVVIFLGAFVWSLLRTPRPARTQPSGGHFWRDRYIEYEPPSAGPFDRLKRRFRRH